MTSLKPTRTSVRGRRLQSVDELGSNSGGSCRFRDSHGTHGKRVVGLDIEPGYVAAVLSSRALRSSALRGPLAPGVVRDGEVVDVDTLADVLREMFAEHKLSKRVRLGVANQRIVMRTLDLPPLKDAKEIESAVRFQAQDHIPMPLDQAVLEHHAVGIVETPEGRGPG